MTSIKRVNISIDERLHTDIKVILAEQGTSLSAVVCKYLASLVQDKGDQPLTSMQKYNAYQAMGLEERVEFNMQQSRGEHAEYQPDEDFDEEGMYTRWKAKITRELEQEEAA